MIPEITDKQLVLMTQVCFDPKMSVFSQCSVKPDDELQVAINATQARRDAEHLCSLGFLKSITNDHKEQVDQMNEQTGRTWEVYEITAMGRAMFQATTSSTVH